MYYSFLIFLETLIITNSDPVIVDYNFITKLLILTSLYSFTSSIGGILLQFSYFLYNTALFYKKKQQAN